MPLDSSEAHRRGRGYLPHWEQANATYFVTFRLSDSLPRQVTERLQEERRKLELLARDHLDQLTEAQRAQIDTVIARQFEHELDNGRGERFLARGNVAGVVAGALKHFDEMRYLLLCWCIMPNHVHVVLRPLVPYTLASIVHSWKSFTANQCNRVLGRHGEFWQREYYDRVVRDEREFERVVRYVVDNPAKAGLEDWKWVYVRDQLGEGG